MKKRKNKTSVCHLLHAIICLSALFFNNSSHAQNEGKKHVKFIHADEWVFDKSYIDANRYKGNVVLEYEGNMFYCDSAYLFPNDDFDAFSHITITKGTDYTLTGDLLHFDKASSTATITNNVTLRDRDMTLTTNHLRYNTNSQIANYMGGGKIVSNKNKNVLTSDQGTYNTHIATFFFRKKVLLKNADYTVKCDTLNYNNQSEVAYFFGPTDITGAKDKLYCENGWYDTRQDICQFRENAKVLSEKNELKGDSIYYDGKKGIGEVFRNVSIRDTSENYLITGEYGKYNRNTGRNFVTDRALLVQFDDKGDSLYMHADTLVSVKDTIKKISTIFAYHKVRIYRSDIQGICDSLIFSDADSILRFFKDPVLWSDQNQITGDSIEIKSKDGGIDKLWVRGNAFVSSSTEKEKFNQIKGRKLTGYFFENKLVKVYVEGNGQLIYFPTDDKTGKSKAIGLNKGECSNIMIGISDNKIQTIRMERESNSIFNPMKDVSTDTMQLEKFKWRGEERPKDKADLFR